MSDTRLLRGFHAVAARLAARPESIREIHLAAGRLDARARDLVARAQAVRLTVQRVETARLTELAGDVGHQGVVAIVDATLPAWTLDEVLEAGTAPLLLVVLDGVTDPHNLGACLRNADAFGAHAVVVPKDRAGSLTPTVAKAASGAADTVPLITVTNLARALRTMKERGLWIIGADAGGESLDRVDLKGPIAWVFGAEGHGLRRLTREHCDRIVGIPITGAVGSLNVSVACGICLYATRAQRGSDATT